MRYSSRWAHWLRLLIVVTTTTKGSSCVVCVLSLCALWSQAGQELEVKLIRDRHRGIVAGYGFIDFRNHETAQLVLDSLNGKPIGEITRDGKGWK